MISGNILIRNAGVISTMLSAEEEMGSADHVKRANRNQKISENFGEMEIIPEGYMVVPTEHQLVNRTRSSLINISFKVVLV